VHTVLVQ